MTCKESQDRIVRFDQLSEREQNQLLEHIETCSECQTYFDRYLTVEEGLDLLLQDEELHVNSIRKKAVQRIFKRALLTCASLFLLIVGAWYTPPVKAAIEKALNEVIIDHFLKGQQPLEGNDEKATTEKIIYAERKLMDGRNVFVYLSGQKVRNEYGNGNYYISDGKYLASYSKKDNLFVIQKLDYQSVPIEIEYYQDIDPKSIKYIGERKYLDRQAEVYLIKQSQDLQREYWFDKETSIFIKEVEIYKGGRQDIGNLKEFEIIEVKKNHKLFDFIAPDGARIIDESDQ
jgi:hypothetical protein